MEVQELRGREFFHYQDESIIYIVGRGSEGRTVIHFKGEAGTSVYKDEQVVDYFERGVWIEVV